MAVIQLSVFLDNMAGRLSEVTRILGENNINIRGFSVADTPDYGILRLIVNEPERALIVLRGHRFIVHEGPVILARVQDLPGGFATALEGFARERINVDYAYATVSSMIVFGVERPTVGEEILKEEGVRLVTQEELGSI